MWIDYLVNQTNPFPNTPVAEQRWTRLEWSWVIEEMPANPQTFRWHAQAMNLPQGGWFWGGTQNTLNPDSHNEAFGSVYEPENLPDAPTGTVPWCNIGYGSWFEQVALPTPPRHVDGVQLRVDPTKSPRWRRTFINVDGNLGINKGVSTRDPIRELPISVTTRFQRRPNTVTNPSGNLSRDDDGNWVPLRGTYVLWDLWITLNGVHRFIATYYFHESTAFSLINPHLLTFLHEVTDQLTDNQTKVKYGHLKAFDARTRRWYLLREWSMYGMDWYGQPEHGWSADGDWLTISIGHQSDAVTQTRIDNWYLFLGWDYRSTAGTQLADTGNHAEIYGSSTVNGRLFQALGSYPRVQQDSERGFHILHPSPSFGSRMTFTAHDPGYYHFDGSFARFDSRVGLGNGVLWQIARGGAVLSSGAISAAHQVDPNSPFTGTGNSPFSVSNIYLGTGQTIHFDVLANGKSPFGDATAFRATISYATPSYTYWVSRFLPRLF